jgi:hypothetical protein
MAWGAAIALMWLVHPQKKITALSLTLKKTNRYIYVFIFLYYYIFFQYLQRMPSTYYCKLAHSIYVMLT